MRRYLDRLVLAVACVLATGGWVCESGTTDRCPGALTCDVDIATVCCPFDTGLWCDGCASSCPASAIVCKDESHILDCSFNATIDTQSCEGPVSTPQGVEYTLLVTGTLSGCGQETILFKAPDGTKDELDCGSWDTGVFGGCVSPSPDTTMTHWTFTQTIPGGTGMGPVLTTLQLERAHGSAPPVATASVMCGPSS